MEFVLDDPKASKYYLSGWSRLDSDILKMCCIIICSSMVSESVLASLLKDDRVAHNLEKLDGIMKGASDHALGLSDSVLSLLFEICDASVSWLRDQVATSVAVQVGYTEAKLRDARGLPWCLGRGDVHHNFQCLAWQAKPFEPVARKIYALMQLHYPRDEVVAATKLLL